MVQCFAALSVCESCVRSRMGPRMAGSSISRTVMADSQVPPDLLTYNSMITAYVSGVQWEMALSTLTEASSHSFKPNTISCLADCGWSAERLWASVDDRCWFLMGPWSYVCICSGFLLLWWSSSAALSDVPRLQCCDHCLREGLSMGDGPWCASGHATGHRDDTRKTSRFSKGNIGIYSDA